MPQQKSLPAATMIQCSQITNKIYIFKKLGKKYVKDIYCQLAYLTSMQRTSCEMPSWMNLKRDSRLPGKISTTSDDSTLMAGREEELKSILMRVKEKSENAGLKLNIQKIKIMASGPFISRQIEQGKVETRTDYFLGLQNHCRWWLQPWN